LFGLLCIALGKGFDFEQQCFYAIFHNAFWRKGRTFKCFTLKIYLLKKQEYITY
jgi:hypothetical protein